MLQNINPDNLISRTLNLEIGNSCKIKCPECMRQFAPDVLKGTRPIPFEELKVIFDTFPNVNFCGQMSDAIYHREFLQILDYIQPRGRYIISTCGHGHSKEWWIQAFNLTKDKSVMWRFGLDGLPADSHKYRVGQDGESVWEMMKMGRSIGCQVEWQYIVFNYNQNDIETARSMAAQHGMTFLLIHSNRFNKEHSTISLRPDEDHYVKN